MVTVLVVDDNREVAELFQTCLSLCGKMRVLLAGTVKEALHTCRDNTEIDILLSDLSLPDGTGADLLRALGASAPAIKLLITGHCFKGKYHGFDDYMVKPIDCSELLGKVRQLIHERKCA